MDQLVAIKEGFTKRAVASGVTASEAQKIWSRWVITQRCFGHAKSHFLPYRPAVDAQLMLELVEKGSTSKQAEALEAWLRASANQWNGRYPLPATTDNVLAVKSNGDRNLKEKLLRTHVGPEFAAERDVHLCLCKYQLLEGRGLQWALPHELFDYLRVKLQCHTELFASPLNHYYTNYYSLFPSDKAFGSLGSFFSAPDSAFTVNGGCFQVNPPFIDSVFTAVTQRVLRLLNTTKQPLTFVYIMPKWVNFRTYRWLCDSIYCVKVIVLRPNEHSYYQAETNTYVKARFSTVLLVLSTSYEVGTRISHIDISRLFKGNRRLNP